MAASRTSSLDVEIASEYRYRDTVPQPDTLIVTISQSGETADTLAALKHARSLGMTNTLTICNVSTSAMVRECALAYITRAGVESGRRLDGTSWLRELALAAAHSARRKSPQIVNKK